LFPITEKILNPG